VLQVPAGNTCATQKPYLHSHRYLHKRYPYPRIVLPAGVPGRYLYKYLQVSILVLCPNGVGGLVGLSGGMVVVSGEEDANGAKLAKQQTRRVDAELT
jgi:hypothetical protein